MSPELSAALKLVVAAVCLVVAACIPPRDDGTSLPCTTNAQCPATGKNYCDHEKGICVPCNGPCPGHNAPSSDSGSSTDTSVGTSDAATPTAATEDTGQTVASEDGTVEQSAGSCAGKCGSAYDSSRACQCGSDCKEFNDCCADYDQLCGGS